MTTQELQDLANNHEAGTKYTTSNELEATNTGYQAGFLKALTMVQERAKEVEYHDRVLDSQVCNTNQLLQPFQDLLNP